MRRPDDVPADLRQMLERASAHPLTSLDRERQVVSFAYGNLKLEDSRVTRQIVEDAVRASSKK